MQVGSLTIEMAMNVARIQTDLNRAQGMVNAAMGRITSSIDGAARAFDVLAVAAGGAGFTLALKGAIDMADKLDDLREKTGLTVKQLSALRYAGEVTGTSTEAMATGLKKLSQNMAAAAGGGKEQAAAFAAIGVAYKQANGGLVGSSEALGDIADKFATFQDGPEKAALAIALFGKSGTDMIPLLNQGADGIDALRDEADRLGATVGADFATQAALFNDNLTRMRLMSEGFFGHIAMQAIPTLNRMSEAWMASSQSGNGVASVIGQAVKIALETVLVLGANVVYTFQGIWRELSGIGQQAIAVSRLDFTGAGKISEAMLADAAKSYAELQKFERTVMGTFSDKGRGNGFADPRLLGEVTQSINEQSNAWKKRAPIVADAAKADAAAAKAAAELAKQQAELERQIKAIQKIDADESKRYADGADAILKMNEKLREEIDLMGLDERQRAALIATKERAILQDKDIELIMARNAGASEAVIASLEREISLRKQFAILSVQRGDKQGGLDDAKKAIEDANKALSDFNQLTGQVDMARLNGLFGGATDNAMKFVTALELVGSMQDKTAAAYAANSVANAKDAKKFGEVQLQIANQSRMATFAAYGSMAGALKGYAREGSKTYNALQNAERVYQAFQIASALTTMAQKSGLLAAFTTAKLGSDATMASSSVSAATIEASASAAKGSAAAAAGIANQASGDPYSAFPRMAAMAAVMAGLGFAVGAIGGGRGGGAAPTNTGTGTVLGDSNAQSASLTASVTQLNSIQTSALAYSRAMAQSLRTIESSLSGVTNLYLRSGGTASLESGIATGKMDTAVSSLMNFGSALYGPLQGIATKITTALFGKSVSINGSGISGGPQTLGSIADNGYSGNYYADVTTKKKALGITYSSSSSTQLSALDKQMADQFSAIFGNIGEAVATASTLLSSDLADVQKRLAGYVVNLGRIDLRGLTGTQINERLSAVFGAASDKIAATIMPGLGAVQRVGEGYFETMVRVASQFEAVNASLGMMGQALGNTGVQGALAADSLIGLFGDLAKFQTGVESYYQAFYKASDRNKIATRQLTEAMRSMGLAMPESRDAYRDLVDQQNLATAAGRAMYKTLIDLAPAFDKIATEADAMSATLASDILSAFTGRGAYVTALGSIKDATTLLGNSMGASKLSADALATATKLTGTGFDSFKTATSILGTSMSTSKLSADALAAAGKALGLDLTNTNASAKTLSTGLTSINTQLGTASSGVLTFNTSLAAAPKPLTEAQVATLLLKEQIFNLGVASSGTVINVKGLGDALKNVDTATFVTTVTGAFKLIGDRVKGVLSSINDERVAVRNAAIDIMGPSVMNAAQIQRGINSSSVGLPSNAEVVALQAKLTAADAALQKANQDSAFNLAKANAGVPEAQAVYDNLGNFYKGKIADFVALQEKYGVYANEGMNVSYARDAYAFQNGTQRLKGFGSITNSNMYAASNFKSDPLYSTLVGFLSGANTSLDAAENKLLEARGVLKNALRDGPANIATATAAVTTAEAKAKQAQIDYINSLQSYSIDAAKATSRLSNLRTETVKYYESQKQLADSMNATAGTLRQTVADFRYSQLDPTAQLANLQNQFSTAYSMSLSTNGADLTGYAAKLNALINPLLQKAQEAGLSGTAYSNLVATTLARADSVAQRLEQLAPKDYQTQSLDLLAQIDQSLAALEAGALSADQLLVNAIRAGSDTTRDGLRAVVAAVSGKPIPAFASGGLHAGGLRLVGENGPELEVTGPSRIYNASQTRNMLSAPSAHSGGAVVAELSALRAELAALRTERRVDATAIAINTGKTARMVERWDGDGVPVRNADDAAFVVEVA